jgi:CheY-like chemotaxis protein
MSRVLVIDDEQNVRATVSYALKTKGFDVVAVEHGRLGLLEQAKSPFDLAIVDIYMPGMDGVKLIRALREGAPDLPIIAISGVFLRPSGRTVLDVLPMSPDLPGVICLEKPFRPEQLWRVVEQAIGVAA